MRTLQASSQAQLRQYIEQIERLEEEKAALGADIRDKFAEAKAVGFDPKIMKKCISIRKKPSADAMTILDQIRHYRLPTAEEEQAVLDVYLPALGFASAPIDFTATTAGDMDEARA